MNIFNLPRTEEDAVAFLQEKGILQSRRECRNRHEMKLCFGERIRWRCNKSSCRKDVGLRVGNWLEGSTQPVVTIVRLIYGSSFEYTSGKWSERELGIDDNTAVDWNMYYREVCIDALLRQPKTKLGGKGMIVEIDESLFTKRKNNSGRVLPPQWIFGGICREDGKCFLVQVPDRSADTLLKAIIEYIDPGSIIVSDCWRGYSTEQGCPNSKTRTRKLGVFPNSKTRTRKLELENSVFFRTRKLELEN